LRAREWVWIGECGFGIRECGLGIGLGGNAFSGDLRLDFWARRPLIPIARRKRLYEAVNAF